MLITCIFHSEVIILCQNDKISIIILWFYERNINSIYFRAGIVCWRRIGCFKSHFSHELLRWFKARPYCLNPLHYQYRGNIILCHLRKAVIRIIESTCCWFQKLFSSLYKKIFSTTTKIRISIWCYIILYAIKTSLLGKLRMWISP